MGLDVPSLSTDLATPRVLYLDIIIQHHFVKKSLKKFRLSKGTAILRLKKLILQTGTIKFEVRFVQKNKRATSLKI